jgi:cellulose synthase/poly-beta-1,6-N-acetylglucosamine synthase-like glycosyltransferase
VYLPKPPTDAEKLLYLKTNRFFLYSFGISSYALLSGGMWLFILAHPAFWAYGVFVGITTFYLGISYLIGIFGRDFNVDKHLAIPRTTEPTVDIYLPCCGEPIEILRNTYEAVKQLSYPALSVYVLDDKGLEEVRALAEEFAFTYISRPNRGEMKKAGNLRYAFKQTTGQLIVIFDADFAPRHDFLLETVKYFVHDPKVAIVQTPQFFRVLKETNWIHQGAAYTQELFYRLIQVSRDRWGGSICVGTNAVYRRKALEPFGGTAEIGYSEDVHTGYNVVRDGWKLRYLPINLACGVCPDDLPGFFVQQYRWAMGSITLFFNPEFWKSRLTVMQKLCYLTGMFYYITTGIGLFLTPIPALLLLLFAPEKIFWYNSLFAIPSLIYGTLIASVWSKHPFGWYAISSRIVAYYAHLFAFVDKLRNNMLVWVPTGAAKPVGRFFSFRTLLFVWNTLCLTAIVALCAYRVGQGIDAKNFLLMLPLTLYTYYFSMVILKEQK